MQVRAGHIAGGADLADLLSALPGTESETQDLSDEQAAQMEALIEPLGDLALNLAMEMLTGPQAADRQVTELPSAGLEVLGITAMNPAA